MQCGKERRMAELNILYEDDDILAAVKPAGVDSEAARGLTPDMVNLVRSRLADGKGAPYVGVIQRLDRPVSGIMVFAKNRESASALSKALREGKFRKVYRAILCGTPEKAEDTLTDWLVQEKKGNLTRGRCQAPPPISSDLVDREIGWRLPGASYFFPRNAILNSFAISGTYVTANTPAAAPTAAFLYLSGTCVPAASPMANRQNFTRAKSFQVLSFA